jgi:hypothetical protein
LYSLGGTRYALNRPPSEDSTQIVNAEVVESLFQGLDFTRLNDAAGNNSALASEVWRMFLMIMIVALMAEALLSLPERRSARSSSEVRGPDGVRRFSAADRSDSEPVSSSP